MFDRSFPGAYVLGKKLLNYKN